MRPWPAVLTVIVSAALLGLAFWDWEFAGQLPAWLHGERVYGYYRQQLAVFILVAEGIALASWFIVGLSAARRRRVPLAAALTSRAKFFWPAFLVTAFFLRYRVHVFGVEHGSSVWTYFLLGVSGAVTALLLSALLHDLGAERHPHLPRLSLCTVVALSAIYFLTFNTLTWARHTDFRTHALDTGTM
ncbi:MAG: hypothetical protein SVX38_11640, partial [Chloroflexota bacterium]|nr:hypothetical protein [Chloroflexota bacterium]